MIRFIKRWKYTLTGCLILIAIIAYFAWNIETSGWGWLWSRS